MSTELARLATAHGAPADFVSWLTAQGLDTPDDLAVVTPNEADVETKLIDASGATFTRLADRVAVTKLWMHCRGRVDREAGLRSGRISQSSDDKLDDAVALDISDQWIKRHNFKINIGRVLSDTLFARRYKELNAQPRRLSIILPEHIRTASSIERRGRISLSLEPGQATVPQIVEAEAVSAHDELWTRIRADFTTMSFVTIQTPDFFPYEVCESFVDKIRCWLCQRFRGQQAPLEF